MRCFRLVPSAFIYLSLVSFQLGFSAPVPRAQIFGPIPEKNYLTGHFSPSSQPDLFAKIPLEKTGGREIWLRRDALGALLSMTQEATRAGISLWVVSGFRGFEDQRRIWDHKFNNLFVKSHPDDLSRVRHILEYSSMPGSSRHHWGTDLDLNSVDPAWWATAEGKRCESWLSRNAARFGFRLAYTAGRRAGYKEEKWHYSFSQISIPMLAFYLDQITEKDLVGFAGCKHAKAVRIFEDYIMGINPELRRNPDPL